MGVVQIADQHPGRSPPWGWLQLICVSFGFIGFQWLNFPVWLLTYSGAFIIPYVVCGLVLCWPLLFVQLKVSGLTQMTIIPLLGNQSPILKGVGVACLLRMSIKLIAEHVTLAQVLLYMYESLKAPQLWTTCDQGWNTDTCLRDETLPNRTTRPAEEYFFGHAVQLSDGIHDTKSLIGHLVLPLLLSWILTFIMTSGGPRLYGWMAVVFAPLAALSVIIFLSFGWWLSPSEGRHVLDEFYFRNTSQEGHTDPQQQSSLTTQMWIEGCNQMVTILSLPHGLLSAIGKYTGSHTSKVNLSWVFILLFVLVLPSFLIVVIAPYMRIWSITPLYIHRGAEFAMLTIPSNLATFGVSTYWSFLFYVIVYLFGLLYMSLLILVVCSAAVTSIHSLVHTPHRQWTRRKVRILVTTAICLLGFLLGLPLVTQGGWFLYRIIRTFDDRLDAAYLTLLLPGLLLAYAGLPIAELEKHLIGFWFGAACFVLILFSILPMALGYVSTSSLTVRVLEGLYTYPEWAVALGWLIVSAPLVIGLLTACIHIVATEKGPAKERMRHLVLPAGSLADDTWSVMDAYQSNPHPVSTITHPYHQGALRASRAYRLSDDPERTYL